MSHWKWAALAIAPVPAAYAAAVLNEPILFTLLFYTAIVIWLAGLFFLITGLSWKFLPAAFKMQHKGPRMFRWITLACLVFFILTSWALSTYLLHRGPDPALKLGQAGLLIFTLFLGWSFFRRSKHRVMIKGISVFISRKAQQNF